MSTKHLTPEKRREIAAKGGAAVKPEKRSFSTIAGLASEAGRKGGKNLPKEKRSFSVNRELAIECGRKGGLAAQAKKRKETNA